MSNISVTSHCNRACSYCFAAGARQASGEERLFISPHLFDLALDYVERSGIRQARLLGGEPTLHPEFARLIDRVEERRLDLVVFSNGLMPDAAVRRLQALPRDSNICVLINTNRAEMDSGEIERQDTVFARLGAMAMPGINIFSRSFQLAPLLHLVDRYELRREVRLGLAHPVPGLENRSLPTKFYSYVGEQILRFADRARHRGIRVVFDCGFVPCMFPTEAADLVGEGELPLGLRCNPIPDILPDGRVVSCYPLAGLGDLRLSPRSTQAEVVGHFRHLLKPYAQIGLFPHCPICPARKSGRCSGGCRAAALGRLRRMTDLHEQPAGSRGPARILSAKGNARPAVRETASERPETPRGIWVIPYIDQPPEFWTEISERFGRHIKEVYLPVPGAPMGTGRPQQPADHAWDFLESSVLPASLLLNGITLPRPVEEMAPKVIEVVRRMAGEHGVRSVTVSNLLLASRIKEALPEIALNASVLMDICEPMQAVALNGVCDSLVVSSRVMRRKGALHALRKAFQGKIRMIVNEACLPGCLLRTQHFHEMGSPDFPNPRSLCNELLGRHPWMRLTGSWVLPQHLHLFDGLCDELKLAGRMTLSRPADYFRVLEAYLRRRSLDPCDIGGGPASVLEKMEISEEFYAYTLTCDRSCSDCSVCRDYWSGHARTAPPSDEPGRGE